MGLDSLLRNIYNDRSGKDRKLGTGVFYLTQLKKCSTLLSSELETILI